MIKKGYYLLHNKEFKIEGKYEFRKFLYLINNKIENFYITGIDDNKNLCPHDTQLTTDGLDDDIIEAYKITTINDIFDDSIKFKKIYDTPHNTIWIREDAFKSHKRDLKIKLIIDENDTTRGFCKPLQ